MDTLLSVALFLVYLAFFCLYIFLIVLFVRLTRHVEEIKDTIKDISFRDTARYIEEVRNGEISKHAQKEAEESHTKLSR